MLLELQDNGVYLLAGQDACCAAMPRNIGGGRRRRASLVIAGTHQLLNTMDAEHHKSLDLMAELEALLAASSQLSAGADSAPKGPAEFLAVEPMEHRANIVEVEEFEESEVSQTLSAL